MPEAALLDDLAGSLPVPPVEAAGGDDAIEAPAPAEAPAESEPPSPSPSDDADPLDQLLRQYDDRNGNGAAASDDDIVAMLDAANQDAAAQQRNADQQARSAIDIAQRDRMLAEREQTVAQLQQVIAQEQFRQHQQRSLQDFERLVTGEQAKLENLDVDENHVKRWMLSEAAQDSELQRAWEGKYYEPPGPIDRARIAANIQQWAEGQAKLALQLSNPLARRMAQQNIESEMRRLWSQAFPDPVTYRANAAEYVNRALERMHREARRPRIDVDLTSDRLAVAAAVRGASTSKLPPEPPVNLGRLTAGQFAAYTLEKYGF
jgi:hypothetical protein